jgi:hypothetical protein
MGALTLTALVMLVISVSTVGQNPDLERKVEEAFAQVRQNHYEKAAALRDQGKALFPYLEKYVQDRDERVRDFVVALVRKQTSREALELLGRSLEDQSASVAEKAIDAVHAEYSCEQVKGSGTAKKGLKSYLARKPNSAKAVLLLSCYTDDAEILKLIVDSKKIKGTNGDGGIHSGVAFDLSVEMALAALGNREGITTIKGYIAKAEVNDLFFIFDNLKFLTNREVQLELTELLKDKRPVYQPVSNLDFSLRVCDLAMTALTSRDASLITTNYEKQRAYTDKELLEAYSTLKPALEKKDPAKI